MFAGEVDGKTVLFVTPYELELLRKTPGFVEYGEHPKPRRKRRQPQLQRGIR